jgi:hypothetical protein
MTFKLAAELLMLAMSKAHSRVSNRLADKLYKADEAYCLTCPQPYMK